MAGFAPLAAQNALGVYALVRSHYSAIAPADMPEREAEVRRLIRLLGSGYRPLWVTNIWRSPNGGFVRRCHHILGHYDPAPKSLRRPLVGLVLPTTPLYGLTWRNPIYVDDILDGLTNDERELVGRPSRRPNVRGKRRVLPRYEALDSRILSGLRRGLWENAHTDIEVQAMAVPRALEAQDEKSTHELADRSKYLERNDRVWNGQKEGTIGRVFVSEKLVKLREAAGAAA